jgi:hypothetical protein
VKRQCGDPGARISVVLDRILENLLTIGFVGITVAGIPGPSIARYGRRAIRNEHLSLQAVLHPTFFTELEFSHTNTLLDLLGIKAATVSRSKTLASSPR